MRATCTGQFPGLSYQVPAMRGHSTIPDLHVSWQPHCPRRSWGCPHHTAHPQACSERGATPGFCHDVDQRQGRSTQPAHDGSNEKGRYHFSVSFSSVQSLCPVRLFVTPWVDHLTIHVSGGKSMFSIIIRKTCPFRLIFKVVLLPLR